MANTSSFINGTLTYGLGLLMVVYAVIFRGFGANDWSGATIMMFIAIMGMSLQNSICVGRDISV